MLHALALGADWVWLADDDGRPQDAEVLATLLACAQKHGLAEVSPMVCDLDDPDRLAFPLRRGLVWRRRVGELRTEGAGQDLLPGYRLAVQRRAVPRGTLDAVGVPDLRLFVRGDEVELHRRLVRSGLPFGTCLEPVYLHPYGTDEFKPILGGRMHTQYPDDPTKRFFTYRNRGYLLSQPGLRKLLPQEWLRFGWYFLVTRRDPAGLREWVRLRRLGRREKFGPPDRTQGAAVTFTDAAAQSKTFTRAWGDLTDGFRKRELWLHLGWQDIKQKYRRSVLGPFWITIATGTTAVAMGGAVLQAVSPQAVRASALRDARTDHLEHDQRLDPGGRRRVHRQRGIDQAAADTAVSVHVYRLVWRQMILFAHNIVIFVVIAIIFPKPWSWADLTVIPALALIMLNCVWVSFCFGILATRYRDIGPLLFSLVQLLFFMTPIIWNDDTLRQQGAGKWAKIIELNPLLHYLDILRAPLLGAHQELRHWIVVVALTVLGWLVAALALRQFRARVPYWV